MASARSVRREAAAVDCRRAQLHGGRAAAVRRRVEGHADVVHLRTPRAVMRCGRRARAATGAANREPAAVGGQGAAGPRRRVPHEARLRPRQRPAPTRSATARSRPAAERRPRTRRARHRRTRLGSRSPARPDQRKLNAVVTRCSLRGRGKGGECGPLRWVSSAERSLSRNSGARCGDDVSGPRCEGASRRRGHARAAH